MATRFAPGRVVTLGLFGIAFFLWLTAPAKAQPQCVGDCDGNHQVLVNELVTCVNIALGVEALSVCVPCSVNGTTVQITDLITAVNNALDGCPATPTATTASTSTTTPISTSTATPISTSTGTPISTSTATPISTSTATSVSTSTATSVSTSTETPIGTATATPISTSTGTPASTATATSISTSTGTPADSATSTPTLTPSPSPTNTVVVCPLGPGEYTQTTAVLCYGGTSNRNACDINVDCPDGKCIANSCTGGGHNGLACDPNKQCPSGVCEAGSLKVATFAPFPFPAGGVTIQEVQAGDANCVHTTVVPFPGGLTVPLFCVPALGATTSVKQSGCGIGEIDSNGGSDFNVNENGDTSEFTVCNVQTNNLNCTAAGAPLACCTGAGTGTCCKTAGPSADSSGRIDITVGNGTSDTCTSGTANAIVTIPVNTLTWVAKDASCPDSDGMYDPGTDTLLAQFPQTLDLTTDVAVAQFVDIDLDGCKKSGLGPIGPFSSTGQCLDLTSNTVTVAAAGTIFSSGGPTYDLLFTTIQNSNVSGPTALQAATCGNPPVINFNGTATRCLVSP